MVRVLFVRVISIRFFTCLEREGGELGVGWVVFDV